MPKQLQSVVTLQMPDTDQEHYLENVAVTARTSAIELVNKWSNEQRRLFCDSIVTSYFQSLAVSVRADKKKSAKKFMEFSKDVLKLVDRALQEVMVNVKINVENDRRE